MTTYQVPLAVKLIAGLALLWWVNGVAPEIARAVLVLILLYLALANAGKIAELVGIPLERAGTILLNPASRVGSARRPG